MSNVMYEIIRHTICGERDTDFDYFESKEEAEDIAKELTELYKEDDGHPWQGDRFYVAPVTQETIDARYERYAISRAAKELGLV